MKSEKSKVMQTCQSRCRADPEALSYLLKYINFMLIKIPDARREATAAKENLSFGEGNGM
ncbi:MAG TPA: hypothetical protein VJ550_06815 [Geomonas sp.]|nr:hypothetical protein [Geomonas sp.]